MLLKKFIAVFIVFGAILIVFAAGCAGEPSDINNPPAANAEKETGGDENPEELTTIRLLPCRRVN